MIHLRFFTFFVRYFFKEKRKNFLDFFEQKIHYQKKYSRQYHL